MTRLLRLSALLVLSWGAPLPADQPSKLPRVLLIGDSISEAYTPLVVKLLEGKAQVTRIKGNAQDTRFGLANLEKWLGEEKYDVIHFNWGLWDLRKGKTTDTVVPFEEYEANLAKLVEKLKATNARLIWASTTPVPEKNGFGRTPENVEKFNAAARRLMEKEKVAIDDLHAAILPKHLELHSGPNDVHFKKEGSQFLAEQVAASIGKALCAPGEPK